MAAVAAFGTLVGTTNAGLTAYFRAPGCTALTVGDVIPVLSKMDYYENEYIIGQMKIWDTGSESIEPNNCAMVRVIVYADGWICAWFDKETVPQGVASLTGLTFVDAQTVAGFDANIDYTDQYNGYLFKIHNSNGAGADDAECPDDTIFTIRNTDSALGRIQVHEDKSSNAYHFNTGNTYDADVYPSNGNAVWWGTTSSAVPAVPTNMSNRLYRAIYEMWQVLKGSSNTTVTTDTAIAAAYLDDGGVFTDYTTAFNNATINDVSLIPAVEEVNDAFYFGHTSKFNGMNLNIGTVGVGTAITWEYWNGAWTVLSPTDATSGFTTSGTVTYTPPADWVVTTVNSSEKFWIRARVSTASFTTQPLLTQGWVQVPDSLVYTNANLGMYSFEDTSALFCLICGVILNTTGVNLNQTDYCYDIPLLTKTIYSHAINYGSKSHTTSSIYNNLTISLNDTIIYYLYLNVGYETNGYNSRNIESIDHVAGVHNVLKINHITRNAVGALIYTKVALVLVTN